MNFKSFLHSVLQVGGNYKQFLENCKISPKDCPGLLLRYLWQEIFGDVLQLLELEVLEVVPWILLPTILLLYKYFKTPIMEIWYIIQTKQLEIEDLTLELEILNNKLHHYNNDYCDMKNKLKSSTHNLIKLRSSLRSELSKSHILKIRQGDFERWDNMVKKEFLEEKYHREVFVMMQEYERDFNIAYVTIQKQDRNKEIKKYFNRVAIKSTSIIDNSSLAEMSTKSTEKLKMNVLRTNENRAHINGKLIKLSPYLKRLENTKYLSKKWRNTFACNRILPIEKSILNIEVAFKGNQLFNFYKIVSVANSNHKTRNCKDIKIKNCLKQKIIILLNKGESRREFDKFILQQLVDQLGSDEKKGKGTVASFKENNQELIQQPNNKSKRSRHGNHSLSSLAEETYCDLAEDSNYEEEKFFDNQSAYTF